MSIPRLFPATRLLLGKGLVNNLPTGVTLTGSQPPRLQKVKIAIEHNASINAWEVSHEDVRLISDESIEEWRRQVQLELKKLDGRHSYLLIDLKSFELSPAFAHKYGAVVKGVNANHDLSVLRYGGTDGWTAMTVELQGAIDNFEAVVFADRTAALAALKMLRAQTSLR